MTDFGLESCFLGLKNFESIHLFIFLSVFI